MIHTEIGILFNEFISTDQVLYKLIATACNAAKNKFVIRILIKSVSQNYWFNLSSQPDQRTLVREIRKIIGEDGLCRGIVEIVEERQ